MASEKLAYWAGVAVMALVLGNPFASRMHEIGQRISSRATTDVQEAIASTSTRLGVPVLVFDHAFKSSDSRMELAQVRLKTLEVKLSSRQAKLACLEAQQARATALAELCPRQSLGSESARTR